MTTDLLSREEKRRRLLQIPRHIDALVKELEQLVLDGVLDDLAQPIVIGDKIVIRNNHRGLQGATGTVIAETRTKYRIRLHNGSHVYRGKNNVEKKP
jgi:hypothetical protein